MRGNPTFLIALAASLGIHLVSFEIYWTYRVASQILSAPAPAPRQEMVVSLDVQDLESPDEMGEKNGTGIGSNQSAGEQPLEAREADADQALLSRDPVSVGQMLGERTRWTGPQGEDGHGGAPTLAATPPVPAVAPAPPAAAPDKIDPPPVHRTPMLQAVATVLPPAAAPLAFEPELKQPSPTAMPVAPVVALVPTPPAPALEKKNSVAPPSVPAPAAAHRVPAEQNVQTASAQPHPPTPSSGDARRPGQPHPPALSLPPSDSDSDPFARIDSATFRDGRLVVRPGRKVKTKAPQILIAGQVDLIAIPDPRVVLQIHIAADGHVSDVSVARSSGSNQIDEPTRLAVYDWWFEPRRNSAGKPIPDVIFFQVAYR